MDKLSICKEFQQTYEFFKDLKCFAWNNIIEHPDFIPTLASPVWEEHFTFANQNLDKQSYKILRNKFENKTDIEKLSDVFAELLGACFLFKNIHPQPIIEFIKEKKDRTPDIKISIRSKNISICVEVTRMSSNLSANDKAKIQELSQNQGKMINVTEFNEKSFNALIDKLREKKSQFNNCKADYNIFAVASGRLSIDSSYFEDTGTYRNLKNEFQSDVDGILFFGCRGEKKLFSFNSNLKGLIDNVKYYEK
jgi:hypothetical protein